MPADKRIIMLADCQSFYASLEKAANPEYRDMPVVVAGDPERRSGIILVARPLASVTTAKRLGKAPAKCPDLVVNKRGSKDFIKHEVLIDEQPG